MPEFPQTRPSLLARVRSSQDSDAWRQFEAAYADLIIRYCVRSGLQLADAEDVRQTLLAKLARSLRHFEYDPGRGRFRDYLGRCVRNAIASAAGHKTGASTVSIDERFAASDDVADDRWNEEWIANHLRRAMTTLRATSEERQTRVFDAILQGRSPDEIAAE